jgi:hypothetical protein
MVIITTASDIRTWVSNANPCNVLGMSMSDRGTDVAKVADAIQRADHPAYGEDWEAWLEEHGEQIAAKALS